MGLANQTYQMLPNTTFIKVLGTESLLLTNNLSSISKLSLLMSKCIIHRNIGTTECAMIKTQIPSLADNDDIAIA